MCLLLLAWKVHPRYELLLAANRDEQHARPTAPLDYWSDAPGVLAGRDLVAGGTWLAARGGRFAAVTNFREESTTGAGLRTRGELVVRYLESGLAPDAFADNLAADQKLYAGFNLILGDGNQLCYASNRSEQFARLLEPGLHALSNHRLGTPWPKLTQGLRALGNHVDAGLETMEPLFTALLEQQPDQTGDLPWPASSGPFIAHEEFGTRSTSLMWRENPGHLCIEERRFGPRGVPAGRSTICLVGPA